MYKNTLTSKEKKISPNFFIGTGSNNFQYKAKFNLIGYFEHSKGFRLTIQQTEGNCTHSSFSPKMSTKPIRSPRAKRPGNKTELSCMAAGGFQTFPGVPPRKLRNKRSFRFNLEKRGTSLERI